MGFIFRILELNLRKGIKSLGVSEATSCKIQKFPSVMFLTTWTKRVGEFNLQIESKEQSKCIQQKKKSRDLRVLSFCFPFIPEAIFLLLDFFRLLAVSPYLSYFVFHSCDLQIPLTNTKIIDKRITHGSWGKHHHINWASNLEIWKMAY